MPYIEYFPEEYIKLQEELIHHPVLMDLLSKHPSNELEIKLAEIAAYCEVMLDGVYTPPELRKLADILTKKLFSKRTSIILLN